MPPSQEIAGLIEDSLTTGCLFSTGWVGGGTLRLAWYEAIWTSNHMLQCD